MKYNYFLVFLLGSCTNLDTPSQPTPGAAINIEPVCEPSSQGASETIHPRLLLKGHAPIEQLAFLDPSTLLIGSKDKTARFIDTNTPKSLVTLQEHHEKTRTIQGYCASNCDYTYSWQSPLISPNGEKIATADKGSSITIWSAKTQTKLSTLPQSKSFSGALFSPDAKLLLVDNGELWSLTSATRISLLEDFTPRVPTLFSPDSQKLLVGSKIFDTKSGALLSTLPPGSVLSSLFSQDSRTLFFWGGHDLALKAWDIAQNKEAVSDGMKLEGISYSMEGLYLFGGVPKMLSQNVPSGRENKHDLSLRDLSGNATVSFSEEIGNVYKALLHPSEELFFLALFEADERYVRVPKGENEAALWYLRTNTLLYLDDIHQPIEAAAFSKDGSQLAVATQDHTIHLYSIEPKRCPPPKRPEPPTLQLEDPALGKP